MRYIPSDFASADYQPEDDIDQLFQQLPQLVVPDELVNRILWHIGHAPVRAEDLHPSQNAWHEYLARTGFDVLIVRNEKREPS